jgi:hypothetical protein
LLFNSQVLQLKCLVLRHKPEEGCPTRTAFLEHLDAGFLDKVVEDIDALLVADLVGCLLQLLLKLGVF